MNGALLLLLNQSSSNSASPQTATPPKQAPQILSNQVPSSQTFSEVARAAGLPTALLEALVAQESGGNPNAVSNSGAIGLTQLMPQTAASLGVNPWNPTQNLIGGAQYLAQQLHTFHGNIPQALAAYNAGPGAVESYGGIPPYTQTQQYVTRVMQLYQQYSHL